MFNVHIGRTLKGLMVYRPKKIEKNRMGSCVAKISQHDKFEGASLCNDISCETAVSCPIVTGRVQISHPKNPSEDMDEEFIWVVVPETSSKYLDYQEEGFIVTSKHETLPNTVYMRKRRGPSHRFATVNEVYIENARVILGDVRFCGTTITRDVVQVSTLSLRKIHSLSLVVSCSGIETYVCSGTNYSVTYDSATSPP